MLTVKAHLDHSIDRSSSDASHVCFSMLTVKARLDHSIDRSSSDKSHSGQASLWYYLGLGLPYILTYKPAIFG